jgi:Family of unknown function (DUF6049)
VTRALASLAVAVMLVAGPADARSQEAAPTLEVVLAGISTVVGPGTPLDYRVRVRNRGPEPVGGLHVQASLGQPVDTRSALASLLTTPGGQIAGLRPLDDFRPAVAEVAAGASQPLEARQVPLSAGLVEDRAGVVLPLAIRVEATSPAGTVEARLATFVVVLPARVVDQPLRAALLVPLHEPTHRNPAEDFVDDELARLLAPGGALGAIATELASGEAPPVTMVVDAMLVEEATAMVGGWRLRAAGERTQVPASDRSSRDADAFLRRLKASASDHPPAAFPYANADLPALVRAGPGRGDQALRFGRDLLENGLGTPPDKTLAWPVDGAIDGALLQTLDQNGGEVVVLDPRHLPAPATGVTQNATVVLGGGSEPQRALVGDAALSAALTDPRSQTAPVEWAQRILAETAVAWLERPNSTDPRGILLAPPHDWRPAPAFFRSLVRGLGGASWLRLQTASRLAVEVPQGPDEGERRLATVTATDVAAGLPRAYLNRVEESRRRLKSFQRAVRADFEPSGGGDPDRNLLVAESSDWRPDAARARGRGFIRAVDQGIRTVYRRVEVGTTPVTLTARRGIIPITLANQSEERITVVLRLTSPKVDLPAAGEPFVLEPHRRTTQRLEVGTRTTGTFPIRVDVLTPDGRDVIAGGEVRLISTAFNRVALALTGGAAGVLLLWWRLRLRRRPEAATGTEG